jgi:peptidoglycan/LPS O-acetylase OafA/YrhL
MYYVSIAFLILFVFIATDWKLEVGFFSLLHSLIDWGIFAITNQSKVNGFQNTTIINAGVVWSLPFEWLFYFGLPIFALFLRKKTPQVYVLAGILVLMGYLYLHRNIHISYILSFIGGAIAAYLVKYKPGFKINSYWANILILICLFGIVQFSTADNHFCKFLIATAFILIAYGHNLFGILHYKSVKFLGEICYSTYLIHGLILFATFYFGIGLKTAKSFSPTQYCTVIFLITPLVVIFSFLGYRYIEKPFMNLAKKINNTGKKLET